jgi:hypothetical protein
MILKRPMHTEVLPALEIIPKCYANRHNSCQNYLCRHDAGLGLGMISAYLRIRSSGAKGIVLACAGS